jgi:hypothetical protein
MDDMGERCLKDGQVTLKLLLTYELLCKTGRHLPVSIYCAHSPRYVTVGASIARPVAVLLRISASGRDAGRSTDCEPPLAQHAFSFDSGREPRPARSRGGK